MAPGYLLAPVSGIDGEPVIPYPMGMAVRIGDYVCAGELDNRTPGRVVGHLQLAGTSEPVRLELEGNCFPDLAGCHITFEAESAEDPPADFPELGPVQRGTTGDITASRKARVPQVPIEEFLELKSQGLPAPEKLCNVLYLEWYSRTHGRVVLESASFTTTISDRVWVMTPEQEAEQQIRSEGALASFLDAVTQAGMPSVPADVPDNRDMNEFEWERLLKQSDARGKRYRELLEKYEDDPQGEDLVASHMGWVRDPGDGEEAGTAPWEDAPNEAWEEPQPDPAREGIDWIRTKRGRIEHPLAHTCARLSHRLIDDERHRWGKETDTPECFEDMAFAVHQASAKLAGGLNSIGSTVPPEPGFVIAYLKRALGFLNEAIDALGRIEAESIAPDLAPDYRQALFGLREQILELAERYRAL